MSHAQKWLQTATAHHQAGRFDQAEKAYQKLLRIEAVNTDGLRLLGGLYLQTGQMTQAIVYLEKAARLLPEDPEVLTNLGVALRRSGRADDAIKRYEQALSVQPSYVSALTNLGGVYHEIGKTLEALRCYQQVMTLKPDYAPAHFNYANTLLVSGKVSDAISEYEEAIKLKPDYMEAMINLGMALCQGGRGEQGNKWLAIARSWFDKALQVNPDNVVALNNIANVLRQQGKPEESVSFYRRALRLKPDYAEAAINLSTSLRDLGRLDEAIASCELALRHMPNSVAARINLGTLFQDLMRHEEAIRQFTMALDLKPTSIDAKWNKSLSLLATGQYAEGWALHEVGLGVAHMRGEYPSPETRWAGEDLTGKRLLIWCEQGFGDSLQFVRYAALCKERGAHVMVVCPAVLRRLFSHCCYIDELPEAVQSSDFDTHIPMMSLPLVFGTLIENIPCHVPYLEIGADTREAWAIKFQTSNKLKVGLVWAGNPREQQINAHMADRRRSMSLDMLKPLFAVPNVQFYNLQMGTKATQIDQCGLRDRFIDPMIDVRDFEDTAAIMEHLDLVISVDTSVVHLAGGLGRPVWIMSRYDACWRWLQNHVDSPWYPTARVFGQLSHGDWLPVIDAVRAALSERAC